MIDPNDSMNDSDDEQTLDEMSDYLQVFLDETDEELESLVDALLRLETAPDDTASLNEAFRLMHSLKGSSGMMGYLGLSELAHQLENRFDSYRSGDARLDRAMMDVILECMDFMRSFSSTLRGGGQVSDDATDLIDRLATIDASIDPSSQSDQSQPDEPEHAEPSDVPEQGRGYRVRVTFEKGLQLVDLKARLIVARLSNIGEIIGSKPPVEDLQSFEDISQFAIVVWTLSDPDEVRRIAEVDGVESAEIELDTVSSSSDIPGTQQAHYADEEDFFDDSAAGQRRDLGKTLIMNGPLPEMEDDADFELLEEVFAGDTTEAQRSEIPRAAKPIDESPRSSEESKQPTVSETVRVETNRLDRLMNLTGELIVTKARFTQITDQLMSSIRKFDATGRIEDVSEQIRQNLDRLKQTLTEDESANANHSIWQQFEEELSALSDQSKQWKLERGHFKQVSEAVDQLTRVSAQLQQGVLDTRMVPVGPLFNRFKRVIRDLSLEFDKQVRLVIKGEKTELDKRMIDELGDPLLHLIRNSLDHGLEAPADRHRAGKPEFGTVSLEASHSGNNVLITISDDGAGLNVERIRARVLERGLATSREVEQMPDAQICDFIWHPGFSTAEQVTDISGRGVGMDIVKKRIAELKGTVDVESRPGQGTRFQIRLPLTLAIIHSLLVRFRDGLFSIPIDDVREVVALSPAEIFQVHNRQTIDIRGEFIPLVGMSNQFEWNYDLPVPESTGDGSARSETERASIVILQSGHQILGLRVDELVGGADTVVKSLSENFIPIKGLSGASIMGDGSVCLMLDSSALIELARQRSASRSVKVEAALGDQP